jgi:L-cysteine:1D-myo-inositol 2-amino-2-deoxy-alpha-D-glucopyranoside ligase
MLRPEGRRRTNSGTAILPPVHLYDEQTGGMREVEIRPRMTIYVCGITPYDSAHLGHAFTYTHFDVLVRYLRHLGADVVHAQNITDVDDDMLRTARERGVDFRELADREVASFERAMRGIGNRPPTFSPRATDFVPHMVEEVQAILAAGHGYVRKGTVYFRVSSDPQYGRLSGLPRDQMVKLAGERGGHPEDPNKDDPLDFVLWQPSEPDEPWWESPWSRGRPGWHIECSTMARRLLGQPVDFHGGGKDLIFPHHESELAQAEAISDPRELPFVRHWVHTGAVYMGGDKMSKSLGNLTFVRDLLERSHPAAIRAFLLRHHYRQDFTFSGDELERPERAAPDPDTPREPVPGTDLRTEFYAALDNDLDTPAALRILDVAGGSADPADRALAEEGTGLLGLDLDA